MGERRVRFDDETGADDSPADPVVTRSFVWEGQGYEVDLADSTWNAHTERMAALIAVSRTTRRLGQSAPRPARTPNDPEEVAQARRWAAHHNISVSDKGRFPDEVITAWRANDPSLVRHRYVGEAPPPQGSLNGASGVAPPPAAPG